MGYFLKIKSAHNDIKEIFKKELWLSIFVTGHLVEMHGILYLRLKWTKQISKLDNIEHRDCISMNIALA